MITLSTFCTASTDLSPEIDPKLKRFIKRIELHKSKLQGGAIAILHKDQVIYKTTFGNQWGNKMPITSKTLFPLASVSKSISATIIALMVERGELSFDEKIKLPYLKQPVSLTHILGHTTGYQFSGNRELALNMAREKLLAILSNKIPKCEPGKYYSYSNLVFSLIEEVLDTKSLSFQLAVQQLREVLKPMRFKSCLLIQMPISLILI